MKIQCRTCGCHFDDDFEETMRPECGMWSDRGFHRGVSREHKLAMWNMYFSVPVDAIADDSGVIVSLDMRAYPNKTYEGNEFEANVPSYRSMTDRQKRDFQKRLSKFLNNQSIESRFKMWLTAMGEWESLVEAQTLSVSVENAGS